LSDFEKKTTCTANFLPYSGHGIKPLQLVKSEGGGGGEGQASQSTEPYSLGTKLCHHW